MYSLGRDAVDYYRDLTLDNSHDDSAGDVNGPGWFALFREDRVIYEQDTHGFRYAGRVDTDVELLAAWDAIAEECDAWFDDYDYSESDDNLMADMGC